ncbi:hypothetical protein DXB41_02765 [Segatella copri]|nr:hypothetical protein DXB41_02765 [Segatella copri]
MARANYELIDRQRDDLMKAYREIAPNCHSQQELGKRWSILLLPDTMFLPKELGIYSAEWQSVISQRWIA